MKAFMRSNASKAKAAAIVENDEDLSSIYSTILKNMGYSPVFAARNGEEIIRWISSEAASPAVVIINYELPTIDGLDAAREVLQRRPGTRIIITSAHGEIAEEASLLGLSFIEKPFSMKKLVREVEAIRHRLLIVASPGTEFLAIPTGL